VQSFSSRDAGRHCGLAKNGAGAITILKEAARDETECEKGALKGNTLGCSLHRRMLTNIVHLGREAKPVVYIALENSFCTLRRAGQLGEMLDRSDLTTLARINGELQGIEAASASSRKVDSALLL
jgi:hypothetical protein